MLLSVGMDHRASFILLALNRYVQWNSYCVMLVEDEGDPPFFPFQICAELPVLYWRKSVSKEPRIRLSADLGIFGTLLVPRRISLGRALCRKSAIGPRKR
jgi:hypothetical protein